MTSSDRTSGKRRPPFRILIPIAASVAIVLGSGALAIFRIFIRPPAPQFRTDGIRVAAIGDSNTFGLGVVLHHRSRNSYPAQLQTLLGDQYQVLNYGLNSRTLLSSGDQPYTEDRFFTISQAGQPQVVLIMLGTNDAKTKNWNAAEYERQLERFAASYRDLASSPAVYLVTPPAAFTNRVGIQPGVVAGEVRTIVERVGARMGLPVVDAFGATESRSDLFRDGIHPNAEGYGLIAVAVHAQLRPALP